MAKRKKSFICSECNVEYNTIEPRTICDNCLDTFTGIFDQQTDNKNRPKTPHNHEKHLQD